MNSVMVVKLGPGVSEQSHKNYIFMASPFDLPAEDDASGLGVEYDIEKDYGIVGGGSGDVETFIKTGEIQLMINEMYNSPQFSDSPLSSKML